MPVSRDGTEWRFFPLNENWGAYAILRERKNGVEVWHIELMRRQPHSATFAAQIEITARDPRAPDILRDAGVNLLLDYLELAGEQT